MKPLEVAGAGIISSLGLSWASSCAASRAGLLNVGETHFLDAQGEPIRGCAVPLEDDERGLDKLARFLCAVVDECLAAAPGVDPAAVPVLTVVAEPQRPGRFADLDAGLLPAVAALRTAPLARESAVFAGGRAGFAAALREAERLLYQQRLPCCLVAGVDTLLTAPTLRAYDADHRILTGENSNGFIPGEAGGALLLRPVSRGGERRLAIAGLGTAIEKATLDGDVPLRGDGLAAAIRAALADAGCTYRDVGYRIIDAGGEQRAFREASLALVRTLMEPRPEFPVWTPADGFGEIGAATGPCYTALALAAARKGYAPGPGALLQLGNDAGERTVVVLREVA